MYRLIGQDGAVRLGHPREIEVERPSFAGLMSTVTVSPALSELLLQPARSRMPGARPSAAHATFPPFPSSTVTCSQVCGFTHWNSLTTPVTRDHLGHLVGDVAVMGLHGSRVKDNRRQYPNGHDSSTDHEYSLLDDAGDYTPRDCRAGTRQGGWKS